MSYRRPWVLAAVLFLFGAALLAGGVRLALLHGSLYYLVSGAALVACGLCLAAGQRAANPLFLLLLAGTIVWAFWESGLNAWALTPRILPFLVLGAWLAMPWVQRRLTRGPRLPFHRGAAAGAAVLVLAAAAGAIIAGSRLEAAAPSLSDEALAMPAAGGSAQSLPSAGADWRNYGGTLAGRRFSSLDEITPQNVGQLELLWSFRTGDLPRPGEQAPREFTDEATPLKVGDTVYLCTPHDIVIALDADSGQERWRHDPRVDASQAFVISCRGVAFHGAAPDESRPPDEPCVSRILVGTLDARLLALDARTGQPCAGFGEDGEVNLLEDMGPVRPGFHYETSPPTVVGRHVVVGGWINDNQSTSEPSGVVRCFDVVTGKLQWAWDMGAPDRIGAPPEGQSYTRDTPNAWTVFAADPTLNLVYVPTGNAPPDFYGAGRRPFDERYSSSLVALDLDTGRPRWSFQTTHHDLWDYDVPAQPALVDLARDGRTVPVVVQPTKRGEIFVLDRRTGVPVLPVEERPVPQDGHPPGEHLSPTQPFSAMSLLPPPLEERDMWGVTPVDQMMCRIRFRQSAYHGIFTPQSTRPVINYPGALGVVDWGSVAVDPDHGIVLANTSALPYRDQLVPRDQAPEGRRIEPTTVRGKNGKPQPGANYAWSPQVGTPYVMHTQPFMGPLQVPCTEPPWGFLQALDLRTGQLRWKRPIGSARDSGPFGIPSHLPLPMGVPNLGGSLATRGGLVFNGGTLDLYLRAYDASNGRELWKSRLPAGGQATPMSYLSSSGHQVVLIAAGGHQGLQSPTGDYVLAYALP